MFIGIAWIIDDATFYQGYLFHSKLFSFNLLMSDLTAIRLSSNWLAHVPSIRARYLDFKKINKLGLNWAKLSSNWNWGLLWLRFAVLHWWLPTTIAYPEPNKPANLLAYWLAYLLTCMLTCLLTFQYTYLLTVNSNHPKSHNSYPLNFHRLYLVNFKFMIYLSR